jgi:hypothetical protein
MTHMAKTHIRLICATGILLPSLGLHAEKAAVIVKESQWPPIKATIEGPFPLPKPGDGFIEKSVSLEQFAKDEKVKKFIRPQRLRVLSEEPGYVQVMPRFQFAGPELKSRHIELDVRALDKAGHVLSKSHVRCSDARITAKKPMHLGPATIHFEPIDKPVIELEFANGAEKSVDRIEVEFREP